MFALCVARISASVENQKEEIVFKESTGQCVTFKNQSSCSTEQPPERKGN